MGAQGFDPDLCLQMGQQVLAQQAFRRLLSFTEAERYAVSGGQRTLVMKVSATMAVTPMNR
jgi:hypothetical protein